MCLALTFTQVVHGLSVPLGKLGYRLPRTISSAIISQSVTEDPEEPDRPFHIRERIQNNFQMPQPNQRQRNDQRPREIEPPRPVFRIGGSVIPSGTNTPQAATFKEGAVVEPVDSDSGEASKTSGSADDVRSVRSLDGGKPGGQKVGVGDDPGDANKD